MDNSEQVIKRWRILNKVYLGLLGLLFLFFLIVFLTEFAPLEIEQVVGSLRDLIVFFIWYAIADHCACEKRGHQFIVIYILLNIIGMFSSLAVFISVSLEKLSILFSGDITGLGTFFFVQQIPFVAIPFVCHGMLIYFSYQLYELNHKKNNKGNKPLFQSRFNRENV